MSEERFERVGEKGHTVLECLRDGRTDTRQIRKVTTLTNDDVNNAYRKLEDLGLIETRTPEGRVTEIEDGQERNFKAPTEAWLTDAGLKYFAWTNRETTKHQDMTHDELVERVNELEDSVARLESSLEIFKKQVQQMRKER